MYPNERAKLAAELYINRAREPKLRNETEVWQLTTAQIERQEKATADDLSYAIRRVGKSYPACASGPCNQGRKICPTPESCRLPEGKESGPRDNEARKLIGWFLAAMVAFAVFSFAAIKWG